MPFIVEYVDKVRTNHMLTNTAVIVKAEEDKIYFSSYAFYSRIYVSR